MKKTMLLKFLKQSGMCIYKDKPIFANIGKMFSILPHLFLAKINLKYGNTRLIVGRKLRD